MNDEQNTNRDQAVRRSGQIRRALVGTSVAGSLGLAVVLGVGALGTGSTVADGSTTSQSSQTSEQSSTAGSVTLGQGTGSSHASTSGS
jgi:hypothetical protein